MDTMNETWATQGLLDMYMEIMHNKSDPRVQGWLMMNSPMPTFLLCLCYVYFVKWLGPRLMQNRKPVEMRKVLAAYNILQVSYNAWLFYEIVCMCWWYYICKITEFFDTISFVLRKKNDSISWLHVIHHGTMPLSVWFGVKFTPGGHSIFFGLLNTFVHILMYSYYFLASLGPMYQKYIWWKKYLTALQMVQFVMIMVHSFQLLFRENCEYPVFFVWWIGCHAIMFYVFFAGFFREKYGRAAKELETAQKSTLKED